MSLFGFATQPASSHVPVVTDRIPDSEQRGWNAGYLIGEQERVALATANSELRSQIREYRARLHAAYTAILTLSPPQPVDRISEHMIGDQNGCSQSVHPPSNSRGLSDE